MSAKEALEAILSDESLSADSMLSSALSTARTHRMGTSRLGKLLADRTDVPIPETVEEIVRELVSHSTSQLTVNKLARDAIVEKTQGWTESPNEVTSGAVHLPPTGTRRPTVSSKISAAADHETASTSVSTQTQSTEHLDHSTQTPTELFREHEPLQKDLMKSILLLLEEFKKEKQAAADREDRLNRKIQALTNQVRDLSIAFDEERNSNCEREQRLAKLVNDMKCRLPKTPTTTVSSSTKIVDPPLSMEKSPALAAAAAHETSSQTPVLNKSREIADRIRMTYTPDIETETASTAPQKWTTVTRKNTTPTRKPTAPEEKKKPLGKLVGAQRIKKQVFYLGGIDPDCAPEDIHSFCEDRCRLVDCRILPSRRSGTQAARIVVRENDANTLQSLDWPQHVYLRRWQFDDRESYAETSTADARRLKPNQPDAEHSVPPAGRPN